MLHAKIKRFICIVAILCVFMGIMPVEVKAAEKKCGDNITWEYSGGSLTITGYGVMYDYTDSPPWYKYRSNLRSAFISTGYYGGPSSIGERAFYECSRMYEISIPRNVKSIGDEAFFLCVSLRDIELPKGLISIGDNAFYRCESLKNINIPDTVKTIESCAFVYCKNLESIDIPDGVERIELGTFYDCKNLKSITIPASITYIGDRAFTNCDSLVDIYYGGTPSQWYRLISGNNIGTENDVLRKVTVHYTTHKHQYYSTVTKQQTCSETGVIRYYCDCGESYTESIPKSDHNYTTWSKRPPATCTVNGKEVRECLVCGYSQSREILATGHSEVAVAGKEATCTETGLIEGKKCSTCGEFLVKQETIPVKGHTFENGSCTICGERDVVVVKGDVNNDVETNSADVNLLYRVVMGYAELANGLVADVNGDGKVNSADVNLLYRYVMGYVSSL